MKAYNIELIYISINENETFKFWSNKGDLLLKYKYFVIYFLKKIKFYYFSTIVVVILPIFY